MNLFPYFVFLTFIAVSGGGTVFQKSQSDVSTLQRTIQNGAQILDQAHQTFSKVESIFHASLTKHQEVVAEEVIQLLPMVTIIVDEGVDQMSQMMTGVLSSLTSEMALEELIRRLENAINDLRLITSQTVHLIEGLVTPFDVVDRVIYISFRMNVDIEEAFTPLIDLMNTRYEFYENQI